MSASPGLPGTSNLDGDIGSRRLVRAERVLRRGQKSGTGIARIPHPSPENLMSAALPIWITGALSKTSIVAFLKFEWVKLARGRRAEELGTGGTWPKYPLRQAGRPCRIDSEASIHAGCRGIRGSSFWSVLSPTCVRRDALPRSTPGFSLGRRLPDNPLEI